MGRRLWKLLVPAVVILSLVIGQFSFVSALPGIFGQVNLLLIALIFTLFFVSFRAAVISALAAGFLLDFLSFTFFGYFALVFVAVVFVARAILKNWLTNRSFYAFCLLMLISTFLYGLFSQALAAFSLAASQKFFLFSGAFWRLLAYQEIWSLLAAIILFNLAASFSKRVLPFFLEKKN